MNVKHLIRYLDYFLKPQKRNMKDRAPVKIFRCRDVLYLRRYVRASNLSKETPLVQKQMKMLWKFSDGKNYAFDYVYEDFCREVYSVLMSCYAENFGKEIVLCCVPKSNPKAKNPVAKVILRLVKKEYLEGFHFIDGSGYIYRKKRIAPIHEGNYHEPGTLYRSLGFRGDVAGKDVLLLDDVALSGMSLSTARRLLYENGAENVLMVALYQAGFKEP